MSRYKPFGRSFAAAALAVICLLGACLVPKHAFAAPGQALKGKVTAVVDGDTIRVRLADGSNESVRLIGVDSQELDDARERVRMMAFLAKRFAFSRLYQDCHRAFSGAGDP